MRFPTLYLERVDDDTMRLTRDISPTAYFAANYLAELLPESAAWEPVSAGQVAAICQVPIAAAELIMTEARELGYLTTVADVGVVLQY